MAAGHGSSISSGNQPREPRGGVIGSGDRAGGPDAVHGNPDIWAPRLARVLDRQREVYERLELLSLSQAQLIHEDQTDELLAVLGQRQSLIEQLTALNDELAPFTERWSELASRLSEQHREDLRQRFDEVGRLVESITRRDESDRRALEVRRSSVGSELQSLTRSRGAVAAYSRAQTPAGGEAPGPRFQDRRG